MRTTLTLDDDVVVLVEAFRKQSGAAFKDIVNLALRKGLRDMQKKPPTPSGDPTDSVSLGECRLDNIDNISEVLAFGEGEDFK